MKKRSMKFWVIACLAAVAVLLAAVVLRGQWVREQLDARGEQTVGTVTRVYSRVERRPSPGYRGHRRMREVTVYWLDYSYTVGDSTYVQSVHRNRNLMTARVGDRVRVCYLPDRPSVARIERDSLKNYIRLAGPKRRRPVPPRSGR